jgi:DNA polymerase-3 subunit gamma/tau
MVTTQAFNALLKTLEEPPAHVVFIFATTEFHKIPETILSRCQKFFFKQIPVDNIVDHLMHIAEREGFEISDDAVYPIARASGGSMRDAQSLLDQIIAFSSAKSGEICEADVLTILGIVPFDSYNALLKSISVCDPVAVINEVDRICGLGADISRYASGFADVLRAIRLIKHSSMPADILGISESEAKKFKEVAEFFADEEISRMYKLSSDLLSAFKSCGNERIALEMALLDMINVKKTPSVASLIRKFEGNVSSASSVGNVGVDSVGVKQAAGYSDINKKQEFFVSDNKSLDNFSGVSDLKSKPVSDVSDSSGAVEKIKNIFHGQVMDKGD